MVKVSKRGSYSGNTLAFQARAEGSIPLPRSNSYFLAFLHTYNMDNKESTVRSRLESVAISSVFALLSGLLYYKYPSITTKIILAIYLTLMITDWCYKMYKSIDFDTNDE